MDAPTVETRSPHEQVAEEARALLARQRISGRKAAQTLGWSEFYMSRRLSGKTPFDVNDLAALAGLLGVAVTAFFGETESPRLVTSGHKPSLGGGATNQDSSPRRTKTHVRNLPIFPLCEIPVPGPNEVRAA